MWRHLIQYKLTVQPWSWREYVPSKLQLSHIVWQKTHCIVLYVLNYSPLGPNFFLVMYILSGFCCVSRNTINIVLCVTWTRKSVVTLYHASVTPVDISAGHLIIYHINSGTVNFPWFLPYSFLAILTSKLHGAEPEKPPVVQLLNKPVCYSMFTGPYPKADQSSPFHSILFL
jgi:hypothetical protein